MARGVDYQNTWFIGVYDWDSIGWDVNGWDEVGDLDLALNCSTVLIWK